jgi:hypothetical protein
MRPCLRHIVSYEDLAMGMSSAIHLPRKVGITHLQLRSCDSLDADALSLLLGSLQALRSLDFACCSSLDDKALAAIARHEALDGSESLQRSLDDISLVPQKVGCLKSSATCPRNTRGVLDWLPCLVAPHPLHALEKGVLARHSILGACARNVSAGTIDA